jgi:anti-sigma B factor antagonist
MTTAHVLSIVVRHQPGHVLVSVIGEIDIATVPQLRGQLVALAAAGPALIVDLDQVSFIDAAGLGAVATAARQGAGHGTCVHVVCARRQVRRLFMITGLDRHILLTRTLAEAINAIPRPEHHSQRASPHPAGRPGT